jgi:hypothetical protein
VRLLDSKGQYEQQRIWLWLEKTARESLYRRGTKITHTGRSTEHFHWLLRSAVNGQQFGSLRPDIVIRDHQGRFLAIADAKYKTTRINTMNRTGVATDDLYQLAAYLSGFGDPGSRLDGFLIYPEDENGQLALTLLPGNPWTVSSGLRRNLWFIAVECDSAELATLSAREQHVAKLIQEGISGSQIGASSVTASHLPV